MRFVIFSEFGELLDLAMWLKFVEGHDVYLHISNPDYEKIGDGIIEKAKDWWRCLGEDYIWVFDGSSHGDLQDWLREKGEKVFGSNPKAEKLENDRQLAQSWFKSAGFFQPESKNFKSIDDAIKFVSKNKDRRWILKQNGNAPKSLNHMGKFEGSADMLFHLEQLKKGWNEQEYGKFDCDLMEVVEGLEVGASAFFNGKDFLRDKDGKVVGYLDFEDKKESDGGTGETTGEMGTTFIGVNEDNATFKDILLRPRIVEGLRKINYRGIFNINCIKTEKGMVALEPTCRFGVPSTSYELQEGLLSGTGNLLSGVAYGDTIKIDVRQGVGMVMVVAAKPFPVEVDMDGEATSVGERLWILKDGEPTDSFDEDQLKHIHLENFEKTDDGYRVATKNGYLLTVTGIGSDITDARDKIIEYIKQNLYISGMKYRTDIGERVEEKMGIRKGDKIRKEYDEKLSKADGELKKLKTLVEKAVYGTDPETKE